MTLPPWEYTFLPFSSRDFHDLFYPVWVSSIILMVVLVILYNVRTRTLHRHEPYLSLYEWLLWTGVIMFSLLLVFSLFGWDFFFVLLTMIGGVATFIWVRFIHFPPILDAYERKLARERYLSRSKFARPEATIRTKPARATRKRRRR